MLHFLSPKRLRSKTIRTTKGNNIGGFRRLLKWKRGLAFCSFSIVNAFRKSYIISDEGNLET